MRFFVKNIPTPRSTRTGGAAGVRIRSGFSCCGEKRRRSSSTQISTRRPEVNAEFGSRATFGWCADHRGGSGLPRSRKRQLYLAWRIGSSTASLPAMRNRWLRRCGRGGGAEFPGATILVEGRKVSGAPERAPERTLFHGTLLFTSISSAGRRPASGRGENPFQGSSRCARGCEFAGVYARWTTATFPGAGKTASEAVRTGPECRSFRRIAERARELACRKYRSWEWNYGTPLAYELSNPPGSPEARSRSS